LKLKGIARHQGGLQLGRSRRQNLNQHVGGHTIGIVRVVGRERDEEIAGIRPLIP
jgi:hypothetical protein